MFRCFSKITPCNRLNKDTLSSTSPACRVFAVYCRKENCVYILHRHICTVLNKEMLLLKNLKSDFPVLFNCKNFLHIMFNLQKLYNSFSDTCQFNQLSFIAFIIYVFKDLSKLRIANPVYKI